jgi:hypothetical protein
MSKLSEIIIPSGVATAAELTALETANVTADWETGTGTTDSLISPADVKSAILSHPTWDYVSNQTTISSNSTATFTHGLGVAPSFVQIDLVCKTANNGYSVGDRLMSGGSQLQASSNRGYVLMIPNNNTTEIKIVTLGTNRIPTAAGNAEVDAYWSHWDVVVRAKL